MLWHASSITRRLKRRWPMISLSSPVVVLQSSEMGFGIYEAMGFRTVGRFAELAPSRG